MSERFQKLKNKNLLAIPATLALGAVALTACGGNEVSAVSTPTHDTVATSTAHPGSSETSTKTTTPTKTETSKPTTTKTETEKPAPKVEVKVSPEVRKLLDMNITDFINNTTPEQQKEVTAELAPNDKVAAWVAKNSDQLNEVGVSGWIKPALDNSAEAIGMDNYAITQYILANVDGGYVNPVGTFDKSGISSTPLREGYLDKGAALKALAGTFSDVTPGNFRGGPAEGGNFGATIFAGWKKEVKNTYDKAEINKNMVFPGATVVDSQPFESTYVMTDSADPQEGQEVPRRIFDIDNPSGGEGQGNAFLWSKQLNNWVQLEGTQVSADQW